MRKIIVRLGSFFCAVLILVSLVPLSAFAVDPISQAVMWNAMAQAVTGYGASQGVSMMFDGVESSDTSQIGQNVHDLWEQYRLEAGSSDIPTYASAAENLWAHAFKKIGNKVGLDLSSSEVGLLDGFWNWVLSGPAEMVKVDNQYYEFSLNPETNTYEPIEIVAAKGSVINGVTLTDLPFSPIINNYGASVSADRPAWIMTVINPARSWRRIMVVCNDRSTKIDAGIWGHDFTPSSNDKVGSLYFVSIISGNFNCSDMSRAGAYYVVDNANSKSVKQLVSAIFGTITDDTVIDQAGVGVIVQPYIGDDAAAAGKVYIPDNKDINYSPPPAAIPTDINWDPYLFGDGQVITDAQKQDIVGALDGQIVSDGSLLLDGDIVDYPDQPEQEYPNTDPDDYAVPGLSNVFPFCIPFDIFHFCQALAANPQAPHFTANLAFPEAIGGTQTIELDFDTPTFNQLARILRLLELLAFIVGLALLTRSMFIRG